MDDAGVHLSLPLRFQDSNELREEHVDETIEDLLEDLVLAVGPYREELRQNANRVNDPRFAAIFGEAVNPKEPPVAQDPSTTPLSDSAIDPHFPDTVAPHGSSSEDYVRTPSVPMMECVVCGRKEAEHNAMKAPCGDTYCGECTNDLFSHATDFEINFPPKCCGRVIPLEGTGYLLSWHIYKKFQEKSEEFSTTDRTYCSDPNCGTFIPLKSINGDEANCPACHNSTCVVCKGEAHEGDCLNNAADQSLMTAAAAAGFQQCGECKRMIELTEGCRHIT